MDAISMAKRKTTPRKRPTVKQTINAQLVTVKEPRKSPKATSGTRTLGASGKKDVSNGALAVPGDLSRRNQVSAYFGKLLAERDGDPISQALVPWFCDVLPSSHSRRDYMRVIRHFVEFMREHDINPLDVTGDDIRLYKEARTQAGDKGATIGQALSVLRGMYEQFGKKHLVPWDRVADIQSVESPKVEKNTSVTILVIFLLVAVLTNV